MKDIVTPVPPEETRAVIKKCLENAALVNYTQLSNEAKLDGKKTLLIVLLIFNFLNKTFTVSSHATSQPQHRF